MPYAPTTWVSGTTALSAGNMNNIEGGIVAALRADGSVNATGQQTVFAQNKLVAGQQLTVYCAVNNAQGGSSLIMGAPIQFAPNLTNVPSSITFTATGTTLVGSPTFVDLQLFGFNFQITTTGNDAGWRGKAVTVGN